MTPNILQTGWAANIPLTESKLTESNQSGLRFLDRYNKIVEEHFPDMSLHISPSIDDAMPHRQNDIESKQSTMISFIDEVLHSRSEYHSGMFHVISTLMDDGVI